MQAIMEKYGIELAMGVSSALLEALIQLMQERAGA